VRVPYAADDGGELDWFSGEVQSFDPSTDVAKGGRYAIKFDNGDEDEFPWSDLWFWAQPGAQFVAEEDQTFAEVAGLVGVPCKKLLDMNEPWLQVELLPHDKLKEGTNMWIPVGTSADDDVLATPDGPGHKIYRKGGAQYLRAAAANKNWFQNYEDVKHKEGDCVWKADQTPKSVPDYLRNPPPGAQIKMRFFGKRIRRLYSLPGIDPVEDCRKLIPYLEAYHNTGSLELNEEDGTRKHTFGSSTERHVGSMPAGTQSFPAADDDELVMSPSKRQKVAEHKLCEDCGLLSKNYGTPQECIRRWCSGCAKQHGAVLLKAGSVPAVRVDTGFLHYCFLYHTCSTTCTCR